MYDAISPSDGRHSAEPLARNAKMQRARGEVRVEVAGRDGRSALAVLHQSGSAKARLPAVPAGRPPEVVLLNTAGGLASGDRFSYRIAAHEGAAVTVTTAACERVYRSPDGIPATISSHLSAGPGAYVEWLPQETILFDRSAILRRLVVDIAGAASVLVSEAVILGRAAHGEQVEAGTFRDDWRIYRDGRLVFADSTQLEGDLGWLRRRRAVLAGGTAFATILCAAPDAAEQLGSVRAVLAAAGDDAVDAGASQRDGLLATRIIATDGAALRRLLTTVLRTLRGGLPLPRVWAC